MATELVSYSNLPVPPGELLLEELDAAGMTQHELALRTGRPIQVINEIVHAKKAITHDTALEFEKVLGIPAHIWVGLEAEFQLTKARMRDAIELEKQTDWLAEFPVREMQKRGWIAKSSDPVQTVGSLLQFLGVASFSAWRQTSDVSYRITPGSKVSEAALACWIRRGEIAAQEIDTEPYSDERFKTCLDSIRTQTSSAPADFEARLREACAAAGVAFIVVPELPKSGANGAARWLTSNKAVIQLSLRYKWSDHFWFTFFHEACHVLRHKTKEVHVDGIDSDSSYEEEANTFAADSLIDPAQWRSYVDARNFTRQSVEQFGAAVGVAPGIVVGRLQHEKRITFSSLNDLRRKFVWTEE